LDDFVKHVPVLIDSPPEPVFLASDADDDLVQMPNVVWAWRLATKAPDILWSELLPSPADGLIGDEDAALEQHLLDEPEAQRKSEV
jgi:hypothetical protein